MSERKIKKHDFGAFGRVAYVDNLLSKPAFDALADFAKLAQMFPVSYKDPKGLWHHNEPFNPVQSKSIVWPEDDAYWPVLKTIPDIELYPVGNPVDEALRTIRDLIVENELLSRRPLNWAGSVSTINRFGAGDRLLWHRDDDGYVGAYSFYIHKEWDGNSGGQFLYKPDDPNADFEGCFITPKPNRLVVVKPPILHAVSPIVAGAGGDRLALTGFFVAAEAAEYFIRLHAPA